MCLQYCLQYSNIQYQSVLVLEHTVIFDLVLVVAGLLRCVKLTMPAYVDMLLLRCVFSLLATVLQYSVVLLQVVLTVIYDTYLTCRCCVLYVVVVVVVVVVVYSIY